MGNYRFEVRASHSARKPTVGLDGGNHMPADSWMNEPSLSTRVKKFRDPRCR